MESRPIPIPGHFQLALFGLTVKDAIALYGRWCWMSDAEKSWFVPIQSGWTLPREPEDA
jgi:hypothetical protein